MVPYSRLMTRRALLIGASLAGRPREALRGVVNDLEAVSETLRGYGFACERCQDDGATRSGILERIARLIDQTRADDAIVLYYSGHGASITNVEHIPDQKTPDHEPPFYQCLVPEDFYDSGDEDFRGILDIELAYLIARLAERTRNVSVVLDCCHSGGMVRRDERGRIKALDPKGFDPTLRPYNRGIRKRLDELGARIDREGAAWPALHPDTHPRVVRLEAARAGELAYEREVDGRYHGLLTAAWVDAMARSHGRPVTWDAIEHLVSMRMARKHGIERWSGIAGPRHRLLFQLEESAAPGALGITYRGQAWYLRGGTLHGIQTGDRFRLVPAGAEDAEHELGCATAVDVGADETRVDLSIMAEEAASLDDARAVPLLRGGPWRSVELLRARGPVRAALHRHLGATGVLTLHGGGGECLATVVETSAATEPPLVEIRDARGAPVTPPVPTGEAVIPVLLRLQRAAIVRALEGGRGEHALPTPFEVRWRRTSDDEPLCLQHLGDNRLAGASREPAAITEGDEIHCEVENRARLRKRPDPLYLTVLDVDVDGKVSLRTRAQPTGFEIQPGPYDGYVLGRRNNGGLTPLAMDWPHGMPRSGPGLRSLVLIVADRPHDLRALETCDIDAYAATHGLVLSSMARAPRDDLARSSAPARNVAAMRYAVVRLDFTVTPRP